MASREVGNKMSSSSPLHAYRPSQVVVAQQALQMHNIIGKAVADYLLQARMQKPISVGWSCFDRNLSF